MAEEFVKNWFQGSIQNWFKKEKPLTADHQWRKDFSERKSAFSEAPLALLGKAFIFHFL